MPGGELHLEPPLEAPRAIPMAVVARLMPALMVVSVVGMTVLLFSTGGAAARNPMTLLFPAMTMFSMVGMFAGGGRSGTQRKAELDEDRKDYLRYLGQLRERARRCATEQRAALEWNHPDPSALWSLAGTRRMWERSGSDQDFGHLRIGRGSQRLATRMLPPQTGPADELEPVTALALRRFVRAHSIVPDLPISISLPAFAAVGLRGDPGQVRGVARALVTQLVTFHSPDDVLLAFVTSPRVRQEWEWAKWLPHVAHPRLTDAVGPLRMFAASMTEARRWLEQELRGRQPLRRAGPPLVGHPHVVIVVDGGEVTPDDRILLDPGLAGVTVVDLSGAPDIVATRHGLLLEVEGDRVGARAGVTTEDLGLADTMTAAESEALARRLAPFRVAGRGGSGQAEPLLAGAGLLDLLGLPEPMNIDLQRAWRQRPLRERLRVPFGIGEHGQPVELDLKEAAQGGMGPHGLCIGATGSGKSELLRTLVVGLISTHSPAALNLVLVDFKGGATFHGLADAPHVAAVITNLAQDLTLVDRMKDALAGELNRRQELLRGAGNFANVTEYERARQAGADLAPLPALLVVVDEFSELLAQKPDLAELFVAIGRLGRSLQMHLLLASQRLEEGRLRGLDSHLSYRIGLKTFSPSESRAVLGVPDAYELPAVPGSGYLKFDTQDMVRFKAAYVSGPYRPAGAALAEPGAVAADRRPRLFVADVVGRPPEPAPAARPGAPGPPEDHTAPSLLEVVIDRLRGAGPPAHPVWLPPLSEPPSLDRLLPPLVADADRGCSPAGFAGNGRLRVPVGVVDKPYEQRRDVLWADLSGALGHAVVVGGPQSGKSMLLRTLVAALALTHTPDEAQFYCLDFGGGTLASLAGLPHVGGVAGRHEPDRVRRTVAELNALLRQRERLFREHGIDSVADFRARRQRPELAGQRSGDVFLLVDGWQSLRTEFDALETSVVNLAAQGLSYGVHVVVTANRWAELRPALKDLLGTRFELRLGDPGESEVDRRDAANVPHGRPGRGLGRDRHHFLVALPRVDAASGGTGGPADLAEGIADLVARVRAGWRGRTAPPVRMLPRRLPYESLPTPTAQRDPRLVPIGVDEDELAPVYLDFDAEPHFLCFADGESGKTALLRTVVRGIVDRFTPQRARIVLVDYRRTMLGFVDTEHLIGYAASAASLTQVISDVTGSLSRRLPGPDVTRQQLRDRSWWAGPEVFVVVDDYDLVATPSGNPLAPLVELLPQARDVGLHVVLARRVGGAGRALFEPLIARLRELSTPGIVMSGGADDGVLLGTVRPAQLPPGRGVLVSRRQGQQLMQVAWLPPR
jgi:S-DNA-T family DNA segregation ATPase FtsK/SpoIIIE